MRSPPKWPRTKHNGSRQYCVFVNHQHLHFFFFFFCNDPRQNFSACVFLWCENACSMQDGAFWSAVEGTDLRCVAQGGGGKNVQAQITCVRSVSREQYLVRESYERREGVPHFGSGADKPGKRSASCPAEYRPVSCTCFRYM